VEPLTHDAAVETARASFRAMSQEQFDAMMTESRSGAWLRPDEQEGLSLAIADRIARRQAVLELTTTQRFLLDTLAEIDAGPQRTRWNEDGWQVSAVLTGNVQARIRLEELGLVETDCALERTYSDWSRTRGCGVRITPAGRDEARLRGQDHAGGTGRGAAAGSGSRRRAGDVAALHVPAVLPGRVAAPLHGHVPTTVRRGRQAS
jgi:hypothetical protein